MQLAAEDAVADQMKNLQTVFDAAWGKKNPWGNDKSVVTRAMKRSDRYRSLKKAGVPDDQVKTIFIRQLQFRYLPGTERSRPK